MFNPAAGERLAHQQHAGSHVPGFQAEFVIAVEAAASQEHVHIPEPRDGMVGIPLDGAEEPTLGDFPFAVVMQSDVREHGVPLAGVWHHLQRPAPPTATQGERLPGSAEPLCLPRQGARPASRGRAAEMGPRGALAPWRTINGEEAAAYYAAGTAQVHIDADVAHALVQYVSATGDEELLVRHGLAILVETARLYADLGFWRSNGERSFHIHGVTGPDEYTTVVNNNLFTNVMARYNLEQAVSWVRWAQEHHADEYARLAHRLKVTEDEVTEWAACAAGMHIPFDEGLQIHPQDDFFLDREAVSYTHLRAHETVLDLVCRLLLEKQQSTNTSPSAHLYE